jgi:hypothetical protein
VKIVSLNAWGGARYEELLGWLPTCSADVLCLQEVTRTPGISGWTQFEDGERSLPQRANLLADVRTVLPRHQPMFLTSDAGPVETSDGHRHHQDFGIAVLIAEHLPVIAHDSLFVHGRFTDHDVWPPTADLGSPRASESSTAVVAEPSPWSTSTASVTAAASTTRWLDARRRSAWCSS